MSDPGLAEAAASAGGQLSATWLAILDKMPVGVTVAFPGGHAVFRNSMTRKILGEEIAATDERFLYEGLVHENGQPYQVHEYPLARTVRTGEVIEREIVHYRRPDGRLMVLEVNASRITAQDGRMLGVCTFQDVTEENERRQALREAAERVQLALQAGAIVGTWIYDVQTDVITIDELLAKSFGLDPEQRLRGMAAIDWWSVVHPDDCAALQAAAADALARGGAFRQQYRVREQDGRYRWVEASGMVELDGHGRAQRFPGVLLDITAWKHAEEARTLLMHEVDHRARNALAMIQSVVRLSDASDAAAYREEVLGRIDAMARAQTSLSRTNWEGADLEDLVREEVVALAPADRFHISGPKINLAAAQVQPLDMLIHELVTNALKHGALSVPKGRVEIRWRLGEDSELQLNWRECGGPRVTPPEKVGFGTRLIARLATQLRGAIDMNWQAQGLIAALSWPLER